jgi:hypothetical protein
MTRTSESQCMQLLPLKLLGPIHFSWQWIVLRAACCKRVDRNKKYIRVLTFDPVCFLVFQPQETTKPVEPPRGEQLDLPWEPFEMLHFSLRRSTSKNDAISLK